MFTYKPRYKYFLAITLVLIFTTQLVGWAIKMTYELYNYDGCQYTMLRYTNCPANFYPRCILPIQDDCDQAQLIVTQFTFIICYPLFLIIQMLLYTVIYYFCGCTPICISKSEQFVRFVYQQISVGYSIAAAMSVIATANLICFSFKDLQLNSQITVTSISIGILYVLIVALIVGIYQDFKAYLIHVASDDNMINFRGQLYYFPDELTEETVPNLKQNPVQEVQYQQIEMR